MEGGGQERKEIKEGEGKERRRERKRGSMEWYIGRKKESVQEETEMLILLPGRKNIS